MTWDPNTDYTFETHTNSGESSPHTIVWKNGQTEERYVRLSDVQALRSE